MEFIIQIPDDLGKAFAETPEKERNLAIQQAISQFINEYSQKTERQRKRQALLNHLPPVVKEYRGTISEEHLRSLNDDRINYLLNT